MVNISSVLLIVIVLSVDRGNCNVFHKSSSKLRLVPLSQHVDAAVTNKLQSILPTFRAQVWSQLQVVKRELKADLRKILLLLEEHAGVSEPQTIEDKVESVYSNVTDPPKTDGPCQVPVEYSEMKAKENETMEYLKSLHKNVTVTLRDMHGQLNKALAVVTESCEREIQENNNLILSQQGGILRSLQIINNKLDSLTSSPRTKDMSTDDTSDMVDKTPFTSCLEAKKRRFGTLEETVVIFPKHFKKEKTVRCDQITDGGGWLVVLHRQKQKPQVNFRRDWREYEEGFGDPSGEFWIGLKALHALTKAENYQLRVDMAIGNEKAHSVYSNFSVGPSMGFGKGYKLFVSGFMVNESTAGDALSYHSGLEFSTYDADNDRTKGSSCSVWCGGGGWWYNFCFYANPTGVYPPNSLSRTTEGESYLEWRTWQGYYAYLTSLTMMIRQH